MDGNKGGIPLFSPEDNHGYGLEELLIHLLSKPKHQNPVGCYKKEELHINTTTNELWH